MAKKSKYFNINLPEDVSGKFELNPKFDRIPRVFLHWKIGQIDLDKISPNKAMLLSQDVVSYLLPKKENKKSTSK